MKKHLKYYGFTCCYLLGILSFQSCVSSIDIDIPESQSSVVINSIWDVDHTSFTIQVSSIDPIFQSSNHMSMVDDLHLTVANGQQIFSMENSEPGTYIVQGRYGIGDTLRLSGDYAGQTIQASTIIPQRVPILNASVDRQSGVDEHGDHFSEWIVDIKDPPENNYYEIYLIFADPEFNEFHISSNNVASQIDPVVLDEGLEDFSNSSFLFSDRLFNGTERRLRFKFEPIFSTVANTPFDFPSRGSYVVLLSLSKEYYDFRKSWITHRYHQQIQPFQRQVDADDIRDFLFKGPVQDLYTNIENGRGIFASYSVDLYKVE